MTLGSAATIAVAGLVIATGACLAAPKKEGTAEAGAPQPAGERDVRRAEVRFPNGQVIVAEIADTPERWQRGYMFRNEVGAGEGMVFLFPEPAIHPFWMKNTLVPLDIVWMDHAATIIHIEANVPPCKADPCPGYGPMRKASKVLEVRAGTAAEQGLKAGDRLRVMLPQP